MGLLNSALQIGRSAIIGYESALHVVGNNISSAGSADFTRLSPQLDPVTGRLRPDINTGAGVALTSIQRNIDEALEGRVRLAIGSTESATVRENTMARVQALFDDLTGTGVGVRLNEFFAAFDELQNTPEDPAIRDLAISRGTELAQSLHDLRQRLTELSEDIDGQIEDLVATADRIARDIARLNEEITRAEAGRQTQATALRDQRDGLLRTLSEIFDIAVREQPDGTVNVYVGSEALIQGASVRGLVAVRESDGEMTRTSVRFADTNQQLTVRAGRLHGLLVSRDQTSQIEAIDRLATAIIADVNRIHADGQGLRGHTAVTGTSDVLETDEPLASDAAGLAFPVTNGSFFLTVSDDTTQTPVAHRIDVDADATTLESLVQSINDQVTGVTASITSDRRLQITADEGFTFTFGHDGQTARADTSGVLAALGVNTFFTGADARNIAVNPTILQQPLLLAAAAENLPGDGTIAARIASLDSELSNALGETSIPGFYQAVSNNVAVTTSTARNDLDAAASVLSALQAQRESISGVNLDEEAISLVKFQRAFQGAARFVTVVDDLLAELVTMIR